ncbi:MAG: hypothetical protein ACI9XB_004609, partial [Gammaproteobacteria bacterium]
YTFCVQVFDYQRLDVPLSIESCVTQFLRKNYPPNLAVPSCDATLPITAGNQDILFNWHANADMSIQTNYRLSIAEVLPGQNSNDAINNAGTLVFDGDIESPIMNMTTFLYGANQPPLEIGKRYAYRIQAEDMLGTSTFENDGLGPVCSFYYGTDPNGYVPLTAPENNFRAKTNQQLNFSWDRPTNALAQPNLQIFYKIKIVEIQGNEDPQNALTNGIAWYESTTGIVQSTASMQIPSEFYPLPSEKKFVWQVIALSNLNGNEEEVAKSEIRFFETTPIVERIGDGSNHTNWITVASLSSYIVQPDGSFKVSGVGQMKIKESGEEIEMNFENLTVIFSTGGDFVLTAGEVVEPTSNLLISLDNSGVDGGDPNKVDENGHADFDVEAVVFSTNDILLRGRVKWQLPHATQTGNPIVQSELTDVLYDNFLLINQHIVLEESTFDLLEPYDLQLKYYGSANTNSNFWVENNILTLTLDGEMVTPPSVVNLNEERIAYTFQNVDNPYYFTSTTSSEDGDIRLIENTKIQLDAQSITFDLSETASEAGAPDEEWKGIFFNEFKIIFPTDFDATNQLVLDEEQIYDYTQNTTDIRAWIDGGGIDCAIEKSWEGLTGPTALFNKFSDNFREVIIDIENNSVTDVSTIKGFVYIPVLDNEEEFKYTVAIGQTGMQVSFLEDDLLNREFVFNDEYEDLRVVGTIKQAVFKDNERLELVVDLDWESIEVMAMDVTGLVVWGNGDFGFGTPNGFKGISNLSGLFKDVYPITIDSLGAGHTNGTYALSFVGSMTLGDESSGISGSSPSNPPKFEMVSHEEKSTASDLVADTGDNWLKDVTESTLEVETGKISIIIPIVIRSGPADIAGIIVAFYNDPDWGTGFYGVVAAEIKKPKKFAIDVKVMVGNKENTFYWFLEAGLMPDLETKVARGDTIPVSNTRPASDVADNSSNKSGSTPLKIRLGKIEITELRGRVYHHMSRDMGDAYADACAPGLGSVQVGVGHIEENPIEAPLPTFADLSIQQIEDFIDASNRLDLARLFCNMNRNLFKAALGSLPEPDFAYLNVENPDMDWAQVELNFPGITYIQLELMYPDMEWCNLVAGIPNIDWSAFFFNISLQAQFPDICELSQYYLNKTFDGLQDQEPATELYFVENNLLTTDQWATLIVTYPDVTWKKANELFPDNGWCESMVALPGIDWGSLWGDINLSDLSAIDIMVLLESYLNVNFDDFEFTVEPLNVTVEISEDSPVAAINMAYEVNPNIYFGAFFMVGFQDVAIDPDKGGEKFKGSAQLEMTFNNSGGLEDILFVAEGSIGNDPEDESESLLKVKGCIAYTTSTQTFMATLIAQTDKETMCAEGMIELEISPDYVRFDLGKREFPIYVLPGCTGLAGMGWFHIEDSPQETIIGVGIGMGIGKILETETLDLGVCAIYGYINFAANIVAFAEVELNPEIKMLRAGVLFGATLDVGVNLSGALCDYGNISAIKVYLGGELIMDFEEKLLTGDVEGEIILFGIFEVEFEFGVDIDV